MSVSTIGNCIPLPIFQTVLAGLPAVVPDGGNVFIPALPQAAGVFPAQAADVPPPPMPQDTWVDRSNRHAALFLQVIGEFTPEATTEWGLAQYDSAIGDFKPGHSEREMAAYRNLLTELEKRKMEEKDPKVLIDLEIMIDAVKTQMEISEIRSRTTLPFLDVGKFIFDSINNLLDEQVAPERKVQAITRLNRYVGLEEGYTPLVTLVSNETSQALTNPNLVRPTKREVERAIADTQDYLDGIIELFQKWHLGSEAALAKLSEQLIQYKNGLELFVLPLARETAGTSPELYAALLRAQGVDFTPDELIARGKQYFAEIQAEMQALAPEVAKEKGWVDEQGNPTVTDYREAIGRLKGDQINSKEAFALYEQANADLEALVREHHIVTLPTNGLIIRKATDAESRAIPVPFNKPAAWFDKTGKKGSFVLPVSLPGDSGEPSPLDDFFSRASIKSLSMHEARPGHDLQFAFMQERGVSDVRAVLGLDGANVEGWAMYIEDVMTPYLPTKAEQLMSLRARLFRAARMFIDPQMQRGAITRAEGFRIQTQDSCFSPVIANSDLDRYTFWNPGQATAYMSGYARFWDMRHEAQVALEQTGTLFDQQSFHDFILSQGVIPMKFMREAIMNEWVPSQRAAKGK